jgi:zinc/manganese transport system substrate-binding protein
MLKKFALFLFLCSASLLNAENIAVVAAENFYGNVAQQIGEPYVTVTSILNNPSQDPHLFSSSTSTAKAIANASLIIYNGIDYDPWMKHLIEANTKKTKQIIVAADLIGKKEGDNPHIWYDPNTMLACADELVKKYVLLDPIHQDSYNDQLQKFTDDYQPFLSLVQEMQEQYEGTAVIATEPVFNYMAKALGLKMYGLGFQRSIMNDSAPSADDIADFENKLRKQEVKVLIYNNQTVSPMTERMKSIAKNAGIPIVGVSETLPAKKNYVEWMIDQLHDLDQALKTGK